MKKMIKALFVLKKHCYFCYAENYLVCPTCLRKMLLFSSQKYCRYCAKLLLYEDSVCFECQEKPPIFPFSISCLYFYRDEIKELIYQYKFKNNIDLKYWFSEQLANYIKTHFNQYILIPAPGRKHKEWDQIQEIFGVFNEKYKWGYRISSCLVRQDSISQKKLSRQDRLTHLTNSIILKKQNKIQNKYCLLIDDVYTTGATAKSCANALLNGGAKKIDILTIVRVL